ncbi:MAG: OmpA family protein [Magnetococcales bacterium]|nr:OmpA family protein [Magnetococcales bacterium]
MIVTEGPSENWIFLDEWQAHQLKESDLSITRPHSRYTEIWQAAIDVANRQLLGYDCYSLIHTQAGKQSGIIKIEKKTGIDQWITVATISLSPAAVDRVNYWLRIHGHDNALPGLDGTGIESILMESLMAQLKGEPIAAKTCEKPTVAAVVEPPPEPTDSDGDGVIDASDRCPDTPADQPITPDGCWQVEPILFETDQIVIRPRFQTLLDQVAGILVANPQLSMLLSGHTDNQGSETRNVLLGNERASTTYDYLMKKGVSPQRLSAVGHSSNSPITSNETPAGRSLNRRVEIVQQPTRTEKQAQTPTNPESN